jgi:hypothetical protein
MTTEFIPFKEPRALAGLAAKLDPHAKRLRTHDESVADNISLVLANNAVQARRGRAAPRDSTS